MARLTTIRLYGVLGARFGRVHKLAVQTSAEAVKALCINLDGLEDYLMNAKKMA
jgi:predicted phage tail protein